MVLKKSLQMKKIYLLAVSAALLIGSNSFAQSQRSCGTMHHLQEQIQADPGLAARMSKIESETQQWVGNSSANKTAAVITIPVVVHVVYSNTTQNISDAQVNSQIDVLNEDFRKLNLDISNLPSVFSGLAADCQIQFCLAKRDPNGNATTGIIRKSTTTASFSSNDNVKRNANGGDDPWNTSQYLNIWSCNLSGGLLGYAQFPGGAAATDGVVLLYNTVGRVGTITAPYNKGRSATHEVGHWLNLRHIWGDANCGSDLVNDTPTQQTSNFGCPTFPKVTCSNGPNGDLFMNYMDYTDDACMYMFTVGQSARMTATLNGTRAGLITSLGCSAPTAGTTCAVPAGLSASAITTTSATLNWSAVTGANSYGIQYRVVGASSWTNTTSATTSIAITGLTASTNYQFQVNSICTAGSSALSTTSTFTTSAVSTGCTDIYESNNTRNTSKTVSTNTDLFALIGTSTDNDYYKFTTTSTTGTNIKVVLDQLPLDYDLSLLSSSGSTLTTSQNGSTTAEQIIRNTTTAATYYVRVYPYNGANSASLCYRLRINTSASSFRNSNLRDAEPNGKDVKLEHVSGIDGLTIYPNPTSDVLNIDFFFSENAIIDASVIDMLGKTVYSNKFNAEEGFNNQSINVESLYNGIYFLKINQDGHETIKKFIIKK
jgi:hypothetical protein